MGSSLTFFLAFSSVHFAILLLAVAVLEAGCGLLVDKTCYVIKGENIERKDTHLISEPLPEHILRMQSPSRLPTLMEFSESNGSPSIIEFQAVILSGYGNALAPLTNDHGDNPSPKSLLPIANKPMISFPLTWLEEAGLANVLLICPHSHRSAIAHYVHSDISSSTSSSLRIDIQTYEDDEASSLGTASILRKFANRIKTDFVLLPCDFIPPPSLALSVVLNRYRTDPEGMVISTLFYEVKVDIEKNIPDDSISHPPLIVYDPKTATLLHVDYSDDTQDELELPMSMLWRYPHPRVTTRFADSHVYVCRRSILALLASKQTLESVREDLIPFLCKIQYRKVLHQISFPIRSPSRNSSSWKSTTTSRASSAPTSPITTELPKTTESGLRCGITVHKLEQGVSVRANCLKSYYDIHRLFLQHDSPYITPSTSENIDIKAQVSSENIIGSSTRIAERAVIKKSVIGQHCIIGRSARISGSVLMDHVVVEDGAKIDGCLLGQSTRVGSRTELTNCITQPGYEVESGAKLKGEKLDTADWNPRAIDED